MVAADAEPMDVRSRSAGSQQHELWRKAETTGAKEPIQDAIPDPFWTDLEEVSPSLDGD